MTEAERHAAMKQLAQQAHILLGDALSEIASGIHHSVSRNGLAGACMAAEQQLQAATAMIATVLTLQRLPVKD